MSSGGASAGGSKKDKDKDKDDDKRRQIVTTVLDLQPNHLNHLTIGAMCTRYARTACLPQHKDAYKLDLLRMLAVARR